MALPQGTQERLLVAIEGLENEPRPSGCKKLEGALGAYRVRVGDFRIIYQVRDGELVVLVLKIGNRRDVYR
jgi:mRNA interferase RelE/StbE